MVADSPGTSSFCISALSVMGIREACHRSFHFENVQWYNAIFIKVKNPFASLLFFFFFFKEYSLCVGHWQNILCTLSQCNLTISQGTRPCY